MKKTIYIAILLSITSLYAAPVTCENQITEKNIEIAELKKEITELTKSDFAIAIDERSKIAEAHQKGIDSFDHRERKKLDIQITDKI